MKLKYYTLNYNHNSNKIEHFNIFDNFYVNDITIKEIKSILGHLKNINMNPLTELFCGDLTLFVKTLSPLFKVKNGADMSMKLALVNVLKRMSLIWKNGTVIRNVSQILK